MLRKATVNIGDRQKGRLKASSVIDASEERPSIVAAINMALSEKFRAGLPSTQSLYGSGEVSRRIKNALKSVEFQGQKVFFNIKHAH